MKLKNPSLRENGGSNEDQDKTECDKKPQNSDVNTDVTKGVESSTTTSSNSSTLKKIYETDMI